MKFIKLFIISVVVLFLLITAFSSLLPSKIRISRAINVSAPVDSVMEKVSNMKEWELWNEYVKAFSSSNNYPDSIYSKELVITIIKTDTGAVHTNWRQQNGKSFPGVFNFLGNASQTTVQWYFEFNIKWYPWEKFGSIIYDKELGPQMEKSLHNLKDLLEKAP